MPHTGQRVVNFIWGKNEWLQLETALEIALRNYSKEGRGMFSIYEILHGEYMHRYIFFRKVSASLMNLRESRKQSSPWRLLVFFFLGISGDTSMLIKLAPENIYLAPCQSHSTLSPAQSGLVCSPSWTSFRGC